MGETSQTARALPPDEVLARRAAAGDESASDELDRRYEESLTQYAARLLGDVGAGRDAARVALRAARCALRAGTQPASVRPWLYRITLTAALDLRVCVDGRKTAGPRLPERERRAFVLREVYGLSVSEIAADLGMSRTQVERALFAARKQLAGRIVTRRVRVGQPAARQSRRGVHARRLLAAAAIVAVTVLVSVTGALDPGETAPPVRPALAIPPADHAL